MKEILQTKYLNLKPTLFVHLLIFLHIPGLYMQNTLIRNRQLLKKKQQPRTRRNCSCRSQRLLNQLKNKTLLILLTPTSSQASTGSIYPVLKFTFKIMQAPKAFKPSVIIIFKVLALPYVIYMCIKLIGVVVTPRMHVVGLIYPILDNSLIIIMIGSNALLSAIVSLEVECF